MILNGMIELSKENKYNYTEIIRKKLVDPVKKRFSSMEEKISRQEARISLLERQLRTIKTLLYLAIGLCLAMVILFIFN